MKTSASAGEADFSYFGTGVYYICVPVETTASLLLITFEGSSYYSLLLSEIELIAEAGEGTVQLSEQIYYANGTTIPFEPSTIYVPANQTGNQSINQTFPTLPLTDLVTNSPTQNPTVSFTQLPGTALELTYLIPLAILTLILSMAVLTLLIVSLVLCCMVRFYKHRSKEMLLPALRTSPVVDNVNYCPSGPINPLTEQRAYESIASFGDSTDPKNTNGEIPVTRYSNVMINYTHLKSPLSPPPPPPQGPYPLPPNTQFPVPNPLYKRDNN